MIKIYFLNLILLISFFTYSQEKKNPDYFDGFKDFKFYDLITDHYNYDHEIVTDRNGHSYHKFILPEFERNFLNTEILEIRVEEYKSKIYRIKVVLKDDVEDIIKRMITGRSNPFLKNSDNISLVKNGDKFSISISEIDERKYTRCKVNYRKPRTLKVSKSKLVFSGTNTDITYGSIDLVERIYKNDISHVCTFGRYLTTDRKIKTLKYYLEFRANDYKNKIDSKKVAEHYETYLNDFGIENKQKLSSKEEYKIPLFEIGNSYYLKVQFNDKISEDMIMDTGADQLILSKNLYKALIEHDLVKDLETNATFTDASGNNIKLAKVMIESLQIFDLEIKFVEAYVNTSDNISLLGQSVLKRFGKISIDHKNNLLTIKK